MSDSNRGGESYHRPATTTSTAPTSLDNFFMDFDPQSEDNINLFNEARADGEDYTTGSSSTFQEYDNMPFSSQLGFEFPNRDTGQIRLVEGTDTAVQSRASKEPNLVPSSMALVTTTNASTLNNTSVPEFLYQLTKMLTENNNDVIEWSHGRIEVHSPQKLESDVLKKYFRHSKFASFQRQLNYFGFRKLAGKGKMAPCSYVNDAAMDDISSLFQIKRKSGPDPQESSMAKKKKDKATKSSGNCSTTAVNPVLAGIYKRTSKQYISERNPLAESMSGSDRHVSTTVSTLIDIGAPSTAVSSRLVSSTITGAHHELARRAIGRGIRHGLGGSTMPKLLPPVPMPLLPPVPMPILSSSTSTANSLSELANNYQNSLKDDVVTEDSDDNPTPLSQMQNGMCSTFDGGMLDSTEFLSRNSSLIDLAMLAPVDEALNGTNTDDDNGNHSGESFEFLDFPNS